MGALRKSLHHLSQPTVNPTFELFSNKINNKQNVKQMSSLEIWPISFCFQTIVGQASELFYLLPFKLSLA
jgi:hypothetical protein